MNTTVDPKNTATAAPDNKPVSCLDQTVRHARPEPRLNTVGVNVGGVAIGGGAPIVVQSMTNTDTADIDSTVRQVASLARAGFSLDTARHIVDAETIEELEDLVNG